ncbi:hypothetical protein ABPG72_015992 [Tetrahymena utriculariae]
MILKKQISKFLLKLNYSRQQTFCHQLKRVAGEEIIGIDLGTTNSCVAIVQKNGPVVIENSEGKRTTPSIVALEKEGFSLVGQPAKNQSIVNPENTFYATKRLIGKRFDDRDVQKEMKLVNYKIVPSDKGDAWVQTKEGKKYSPSQIAAFVLMKMKDTAEQYVGKELKNAVITVPAYFNDQQRLATKDAGTIAGLQVLRIINEPTAAALSYGANKSQNKIIAVYDLGGGTFDISIVQLDNGVFEVKATNGDTSCGGEDIDGMLQSFLIKQFKESSNIDITSDKMACQRIREAAEKAKIDLSQSDSTEISLPYLFNSSTGPKHFRYQLTRRQFEQLVGSFLDKTIDSCRQCLKDSGLTINQIDEVLLVGGSSRIPYVQKLVQDFFQKQPNKSVNPDEAVALGAAIQGSVLSGNMKDLILLDVTPLSLGKSIIGDMMSVIIPRNTPVPCSKTKTYTTTKDNQTKIDIIIYQGEREVASKNKELGRFMLDQIPMARKGVPKIDVTFSLDSNGILNVLAKEIGTGKTKKITIQHQGGLSSAEIEQMIKDAENHKRYDEKRKKLTKLRHESEDLVQQISKELETHKNSLDKVVYAEISQEVSKLRELISKKLAFEDIKLIEPQLKITKEAGFKIGESIYAKHQRKQQSKED